MARRKQSAEAEEWAAQGERAWPVAEPEEERWNTAQNRRLPPEPNGERWDTGQLRRHPVAAPAAERTNTGQNRRISMPAPEEVRREAAQGRRRQAPGPDEERFDTGQNRRRSATHEPEEERYDATSSRRRSERPRAEVPPIVNPYSIVALIAALLGLFPVAIVFGLISFSHPRGRVMALFALMIGVGEVMVVAGVVLLSGVTVPHNLFRIQADSTATTQAAPPAPVTPSGMQPAQATVPTTAAVETTSGASPPVAQGEVCTAAQAALIGTASDRSTLLCLQGSGGYRWSGPYTVSTAVYDNGSKCNSPTDKSARTSDGHALVCEGTGRAAAWTLWVS